MKKALLAILLLFLYHSVCAAKKKGIYYPELRNESVFNYEFDFNGLKVDGKDLRIFTVIHSNTNSEDPDKAYEVFTKKLELTIILSANSNSLIDHGYLIDNKNRTRFLLKLYIDAIDDDGEHNLYCDIIDTEKDSTLVGTFKTHNESTSGKTLFSKIFDKLSSNDFTDIEHSHLSYFFIGLAETGEKFGDKLIRVIEKSDK